MGTFNYLYILILVQKTYVTSKNLILTMVKVSSPVKGSSANYLKKII